MIRPAAPPPANYNKPAAFNSGNITGVANMFDDITAKTLDIVRHVFPEAKKIGVLTSANPDTRLWPRSPSGPPVRLASPPKVSSRQILRM